MTLSLWLPKHLTPSLNTLNGKHWRHYLKHKQATASALIYALTADPVASSMPTTSQAVAKLSLIASKKRSSSGTTTSKTSKPPSSKPSSKPAPKKAPTLPSKARIKDYRPTTDSPTPATPDRPPGFRRSPTLRWT